MKALLFIAVIGVVLWWAFGRERPKASSAASSRRKALPAEPMVRCLHCGVHLPRSEAVGAGDALFCSESHRALGGRS